MVALTDHQPQMLFGVANFDLAQALGAPTSLREIGMPEDGLDQAAGLAVASHYWNQRPITRDTVRALLDDAWHGRRPAAGAADPRRRRGLTEEDHP